MSLIPRGCFSLPLATNPSPPNVVSPTLTTAALPWPTAASTPALMLAISLSVSEENSSRLSFGSSFDSSIGCCLTIESK